MSVKPSETSLASAEVEAQGDPRESEVVVKELGKNKWTIFVDGKSMEVVNGEVFADRKSAESYAEQKYGALPKIQRIKKTSKKTPKKSIKKAPKAETSDTKKERKPLTLHKHYLIDIRRHAAELGISEAHFGTALKTQVRVRKGAKVLEISLI